MTRTFQRNNRMIRAELEPASILIREIASQETFERVINPLIHLTDSSSV